MGLTQQLGVGPRNSGILTSAQAHCSNSVDSRMTSRAACKAHPIPGACRGAALLRRKRRRSNLRNRPLPRARSGQPRAHESSRGHPAGAGQRWGRPLRRPAWSLALPHPRPSLPNSGARCGPLQGPGDQTWAASQGKRSAPSSVGSAGPAFLHRRKLRRGQRGRSSQLCHRAR